MTPMKYSVTKVDPRALAMAAVMAVAVGLSGCGRGDDNAEAIRQAKIDLQTLGATQNAELSGTKVSYEKVISNLSEAAESTRAGEAAAARLLRSRAFLRQGDAAAEQVAAQARRAREQAAAIRSYHNQWLDLNAQAEALKKFDPAKALKQVDDDITAKVAEIDQAKAALAKAEQELESFKQAALAAQEKSRAQRDEEMTFRDRMMDKSQTERAELVRQANEAKRKGDGFDMEAADLMARSGRLQPQIAELQMRVQRLEAQKVMQEASKGELVAAVAQAQKQAQRALQGGGEGSEQYVGARQVGERLATAVEELGQVRGALGAPSEEAEAFYDKALGEVKRAKGEGGGRATGPGGAANDTRLAEAAVHHAKADLLLIRARGAEAHTSLMKLLAEADPGLPNTAAYAKESDEAAAEAAETLKAAQDSFAQARDLYESAGAAQKAADVKGRLEQIAQALAVFDTRTPTEPAQPTDPGTDVAAVPPTDQPVTETPGPTPAPEVAFEGEKAEVFAVLQKFVDTMKAKNHEALIPMIVFRNPQQEETFRKMIPIMVKEEALSDACVKKFGQDYFEILVDYLAQHDINTTDMQRASSPGERAFLRLRAMDPADLEIEILPGGTDAEVRFKSARTAAPVECMKIDGAWRVKLDYEMDGQVNSEAFLLAVSKVFETITENIQNEKYGNDPNKMIEDFFSEYIKQISDMFKSRDENK